MEMADVVAEALDRLGGHPIRSLEQVLEVDREARIVSRELIRPASAGSTETTS
jgi:hypothetical protein